MTNEKKKIVFPYFAYKYSKVLNPERYGKISDMEQWSQVLERNQSDVEAISDAATKLSDEEWNQLELEMTNPDIQFEKDGGKLNLIKELQQFKKGGSIKKKKCKCGCEIVERKEGGKIISKCACGCKEWGGSLTEQSIKKCGGRVTKAKLMKKIKK